MNGLYARLQETVDRGIGWLESRTNEDGSFRGCEHELASYYKSLLAFAVCGKVHTGAKSLLYLRSNLRNAQGELASGESKTSITRMASNLANYMDGWIAIGAWLLWDYELAEEVCRRLEAQQSPKHGGVLTGPIKWAGRTRYDLSTAASCGRAFLFAGHSTAAVAAADFIVEALTHQSNPSGWLDLCFDEEWNRLEAPDPSEQTYYRFDLSKRGEKVWFPAFSSAFLCEMHQMTKDPRYLGAAEEYYTFIARCPELLSGTIANGKAGWASGLLARATGKTEYAAALAQIVPNVLSRQRDNGEFGESPTARRGSAIAAASASAPAEEAETPSSLGRRLERTAEFTVWSAEFLRMHAYGLLSDARKAKSNG
ncbi:MAG: hypothetical protein NTU88_09215 [Armatimonadetes bacterium]|nr:hypothetical protein [Armatimonadota bacterium]